MIKPFQFAKLPQIIFGYGNASGLAAYILRYGRNIILLTGKSSFINSEAGVRLLASLKENKLEFNHVTIEGEPSPEMIDNVTIRARYNKPDVVVAIGGGSVLDAGKAISAMLTTPGSVTDYLEGVGFKELPGTKIPFIAVPTTSGTGSEATKNAVISRTGRDGFKKSLRHDNFVPDLAIVDPALSINCPGDITAASGMDCFTQLTEAFMSSKSNEYTDALALEGIKAVKSSLEEVVRDGNNAGARTGMSFAALTSGICLANAGLGVVHGFASSVGALYEIPHGIVCGTLMAVSNEVSVRMLRAIKGNEVYLKKYALLGKLFLDDTGKDDDFYIDGFIDFLHELTGKFNLPGLKQAGVREEDLELICSLTESKNNPVKPGSDEIMEILTKRFV